MTTRGYAPWFWLKLCRNCLDHAAFGAFWKQNKSIESTYSSSCIGRIVQLACSSRDWARKMGRSQIAAYTRISIRIEICWLIHVYPHSVKFQLKSILFDNKTLNFRARMITFNINNTICNKSWCNVLQILLTVWWKRTNSLVHHCVVWFVGSRKSGKAVFRSGQTFPNIT